MATYLPSVQDAVKSIRPPQSNLQFDAQLLTARQSAYDQNHSKLSKMYGTILNSTLSREDNIQARDEFFKLIDGDLKKIAGADLSKDSVKTQAGNVFQQIYTNDYLVKDMVWSKNYQAELQRAESFRDCIDPKECGGQYWDAGVKHMQYKREEFKNATRDESLGHSNVNYVPFNNMTEDAIAIMKELKSKFTKDTTDGKYKVTTENGEIAIDPLTLLFGRLYASNPKYVEQFKVLAYNKRKDEIYSTYNSGEYASLEEASVGYIERRRDEVEKNFNDNLKAFEFERNKLSEYAEAFAEDVAKGNLKKGQPDYIKGEYATALLAQSNELDQFNKTVMNAQKNMHNQNNINRISDSFDQIEAHNILTDEIKATAYTMAMQNQSVTLTEDKYGLEDQRFKHAMALERFKANAAKELEFIKNTNATSQFKANVLTASAEFDKHIEGYNSDAENILFSVLSKLTNDTDKAKALLASWKEDWAGPTINDLFNESNYNSNNTVITDSFVEKLSKIDKQFKTDAIKSAIDHVTEKLKGDQTSAFKSYVTGIENAQKAGVPWTALPTGLDSRFLEDQFDQLSAVIDNLDHTNPVYDNLLSLAESLLK